MTRPAVFLDRDGTLIEQVHHLVDPDLVHVLPNAGRAIRELQSLGYACVIVTNQSVIGRGLLTVAGLDRIHEVMNQQLLSDGAVLDGIYYCPIAPIAEDRSTIDHPDRKPGPGMLIRAAREMNLDLANSWMIGDMISDMLAGRNAGVRGTILVKTGYGTSTKVDGSVDYVAESLLAAVEWIRAQARLWVIS